MIYTGKTDGGRIPPELAAWISSEIKKVGKSLLCQAKTIENHLGESSEKTAACHETILERNKGAARGVKSAYGQDNLSGRVGGSRTGASQQPSEIPTRGGPDSAIRGSPAPVPLHPIIGRCLPIAFPYHGSRSRRPRRANRFAGGFTGLESCGETRTVSDDRFVKVAECFGRISPGQQRIHPLPVDFNIVLKSDTPDQLRSPRGLNLVLFFGPAPFISVKGDRRQRRLAGPALPAPIFR